MGAMDQLEPIEKSSVDELRKVQLDRMRWSLKHAYDNVPHYRKAFDAAGTGFTFVFKWLRGKKKSL